MLGWNISVYRQDGDGSSPATAESVAGVRLSEVETLYKAKIDPELMKQVKDKYPHLLEKPEDYEEEEDEDEDEDEE